MAACWAFLVVFTVLQEIAYIALLWGAYALFRSVRLRTPWPLVVAGLAFVVGVVIGMPRVVTIAADIPFVTRTESNIQTTAVEALRYFGDGLLGRSQGEQGVLRGTAINMHEGVQLLSSGLAALAAIALGVLAPVSLAALLERRAARRALGRLERLLSAVLRAGRDRAARRDLPLARASDGGDQRAC